MKIKSLLLIFFSLLLISATSCNQQKSRTISFKAGLVYKMGAQPVSRANFYLLKEDLKSLKGENKNKKIVGNAYLSPRDAKALTETFNTVGVATREHKAGIDEDVIKDFIVAKTTTDFEGNGKFNDVPPGVYYLSGFTTTRSEYGYAFWSIKVDTEKDKDAILLDQNNAFDMSN